MIVQYGGKFETIADEIAKALPAGWSKAWLHVEMEAQNGCASCFYRLDGQEIEPFELPPAVFQQLYDLRRDALRGQPSDVWSTLTFILDGDRTFHVDYGYEPVPPEGTVERRSAWCARYLGS